MPSAWAESYTLGNQWFRSFVFFTTLNPSHFMSSFLTSVWAQHNTLKNQWIISFCDLNLWTSHIILLNICLKAQEHTSPSEINWDSETTMLTVKAFARISKTPYCPLKRVPPDASVNIPMASTVQCFSLISCVTRPTLLASICNLVTRTHSFAQKRGSLRHKNCSASGLQNFQTRADLKVVIQF